LNVANVEMLPSPNPIMEETSEGRCVMMLGGSVCLDTTERENWYNISMDRRLDMKCAS
jgi:hypothetical protein